MSATPPLRKLQYVLAVARELHFRKAAERLHVEQSSISRQIREVEEELGFEIFRRDNAGWSQRIEGYDRAPSWQSRPARERRPR